MIGDCDITWLAEVAENGVTLARVGRSEGLLIADWPQIGRLIVERSGSNARFVPSPDADPVQRAKIEGGVVRLLLRSLDGKIGLHASAVGRDERALLFLGKPREGKSTLAAALCQALDAELLADDAAALDSEPWRVVPTEHTHFLDDSAVHALGIDRVFTSMLRAKAGVVASRRATRSHRLLAIVRLSFDDSCAEPRFRRLRGADAMACLVPQTIRLALDEPERHRIELRLLTDLASHIPVYELSRARGFEQLPRTISLVRECFQMQ